MTPPTVIGIDPGQTGAVDTTEPRRECAGQMTMEVA